MDILGAAIELVIEVIGRTVVLFLLKILQICATWSGLSYLWDRSNRCMKVATLAVLIVGPVGFALLLQVHAAAGHH